jgi:predicted  nucleic acid-binding Zn ribbon protein
MHVKNKEVIKMLELNKEEKLQVNGGALTSSMLNAIARLVSTIYDLGRAVGSSIRRASSGNTCSLS